MAESVESSTNSSNNNFFCHECNEEISPKLPDYTCPRCNSGFIEMIENGMENSASADSLSDMDFDVELIQSLSSSPHESRNDTSGESSGVSAAIRRVRRPTGSARLGRRRAGYDHRPQALMPVIQDIMAQILGPGGMGTGQDFGVYQGVDLPFPLFVSGANLASNPGNYAWGRGGLDAIITQLMNQLDGSGPPPLAQEKINQIPTVKITQDQSDKNLQCTVCMEDYILDEPVRQLNCEHCYHDDCIIPWLKLHGTCPICRKPLNDFHLDENEDPIGVPRQRTPSNESLSSPRIFRRRTRTLSSNNSSNLAPNRNFTEEDLD